MATSHTLAHLMPLSGYRFVVRQDMIGAKRAIENVSARIIYVSPAQHDLLIHCETMAEMIQLLTHLKIVTFESPHEGEWGLQWK